MSTPTRPRLGLCCQFQEHPVKFRTTTVTGMQKRPEGERLAYLATLCLANAWALRASLGFCQQNGIGAFRINSQILPCRTHPEVGYEMEQLPGGAAIEAVFRQCGAFAAEHGLRLSFHPDRFVVLNSPTPRTVESSLAELRYQAQVAEWVGADVLNIHGGGAYGDKPTALAALAAQILKLPEAVRSRLTLENDDKTYTPADLLPVCHQTGVPLCYDVHHHRCLPDGLTIAEATSQASATWQGREPLFHISSPLEGWSGPKPERHHDYINEADFPAEWRSLGITVDVEAKAKEMAVLRLQGWLANDSRLTAEELPTE